MTRRYVIKRLLQVVPALAAILLVTFVVVHLAPGDPVFALVGEGGPPGYADELRRELGLDRPLPVQLAAWIGNAVQGDLGDSFSYGKPVTSVIAERLGPTVLLTGTAVVVSSAGGVFLGLAAGRRPDGWFDSGVNAVTLLGYAVPGFWLAQMAVLALALGAGLFPITGMTDFRNTYTGWDHVRDVAWHLVLPAGVLAASELSLVARATRAAVTAERAADYARTARAKGLADELVVSRHVLRNGLLPVVTIIGNRLAFLVSGAVVIESVFSWPGLGSAVVEAAQSNDRPLMLGIVLLLAGSVVVANLVTDLVYAWADPRVGLR